MATKQTRRSISVRGTTYDKLRQYGETHGRSMSDIVEELLAKILDQPEAAPPPPARKPVEKSASRLRFNPPPMMRDKRPALANRVVRAPLPPPRSADKPSLPGRPAPTPASAVLSVRQPEIADKDDYRSIRF
jgi:hypothetical protein